MGAINFTNGLGIHDTAMQLRAQRAEVLANNLANADTPGFKARDFDFKAILAAESNNALHMASTHNAHLSGTNGAAETDLKYRNPLQPSIDGNTVDAQTEQAQFARNSMDYNASFEFLSGKFKGMRNAIRGE